jgi:hypothetical protein
MEENVSFFNFSKVENMMLNIQEEGKDLIWKDIEAEKNPFKRFKERDLFFQALEKLQEYFDLPFDKWED